MIYLSELEERKEKGKKRTRVVSNEAASSREGVKSFRIISKGFKNSIKGFGRANGS